MAHGITLTRDLACVWTGVVRQCQRDVLSALVRVVPAKDLPDEGPLREIEGKLRAHVFAEAELAFAPPDSA